MLIMYKDKEVVKFDGLTFEYEKNIYNINDFMKITDKYWQASLSESAFGGIVIRIPNIDDDFNEWNQGNTLIVARAYQ